MDTQTIVSPIIIGYYPVRAKAQICRLLCEYLGLSYIDQHIDPDEWEEYKRTKARDWIIKDIPFLIDGDFVVTGSAGSVYYVVEKANRLDLFGRTLEDNVKITSLGNRKDLHNAVLGLICKVKPSNPAEEKQMKHYWTTKIGPILMSYQKQAKENNWYLGYISLLDFVMYELVNQMRVAFPEEITGFPKLIALHDKVGSIPSIYNYEHSERAVRELSPVKYFNRFKEQKYNRSSGHSGSDPKEMELE